MDICVLIGVKEHENLITYYLHVLKFILNKQNKKYTNEEDIVFNVDLCNE